MALGQLSIAGALEADSSEDRPLPLGYAAQAALPPAPERARR